MARTHRILEILKNAAPNDMSFAEVRDEYVRQHPDDFVRIDQIGSALQRMVKVGFAIERIVPGSYRWKAPAEKRPRANTVAARHEKIDAATQAHVKSSGDERFPWNAGGPPSERLSHSDVDDKLLGTVGDLVAANTPASSPDWGVGVTGPAYGAKNTRELEELERLESQAVAEARRIADPVNHPSHYGGADNPYEAIKVIEAWDLGFNLGNTVKYVARAGKKADQHGITQTIVDLEKAAWYLAREIERLRR